MLIKNRVSEINETVNALINLLKVSISTSSEVILLKEEIQNLKSYIYIQNVRYRNRFKVLYNIDESLLNHGILKLVIQPLVENAIFHGIEPKEGPGTIRIVIKKNSEDILICVIDDGVGITNERCASIKNNMLVSQKDKGGNIGLKNVNDRIRLYFGEEYGIEVFSLRGCGTKVELRLPAKIYDTCQQ